MLCVMHEAEPYGHLVAAGRAIDHTGLARLVGESAKDVKRWLEELRTQDVFSETADGIIYSRRMVRDQRERDQWAERQHKHRDKQRDNDRDISVDKPPDVTSMSKLSSASSAFASSPELQEHAVATRGSTARAGDSHGTVRQNGRSKAKEAWQAPAWVAATAKTVGMERRGNESDADFADRVHSEVNQRRRKGAADAHRRGS